MPRQMRVVLLTGSERRHRWVAMRLARETNLVAVVSELSPPTVPPTVVPSTEDAAILASHFAERDAAEDRLLGEAAFPDAERLDVGRGGVNAPETLDWIVAQVPDVVQLYGTSIVGPAILDAFDGRVVNVHLGLSPYYRGSATNFWPLVNRQPECVGATIHVAVAKVDAGGILAQVRPMPEPGDGAQDLGTKTIIAAFDLLPRLLDGYRTGALEPLAQDLTRGTVFRRAQFNADAVRRMRSHFATGMMPEYLASLAERQAAYPIVHPPEALA